MSVEGTTVTPDLKAVYAKWEQKGPRSGDIRLSQAGKNKSSELADRIVREGKQRWKDKFGDNIRPSTHTRARQKTKKSCASLGAEEVSSSVISQFKTKPVVTPESLVISRPFMGKCCSCMPLSQMDFISLLSHRKGLHNLLNVKAEIRGKTLKERYLTYLVYTLRRKMTHEYPELSLAVLTSPRVLEAVELEASSLASDDRAISKLTKKPTYLLDNMKAATSNYLVSFIAWLLLKFFPYMLNGIQVHNGQIEMVKKASERGLPVIYLPLHRSHLDYILVTLILWNYNIKAPYVAAGDNLNIPFFGKLMKGLGGFFIRRKLDKQVGKKDHIYRAVLQTYVQDVLKSGGGLEFFIEGGRSRSGKALLPKGGLMSIVVETVTEGLVEDAYLVPISMSYEKIMDGNFNSEQMGTPKKRESFFGAVRAIWRVLHRGFGSIRVDFAQPFSLKEYIQSAKQQINTPTPSVASGSECNSENEMSVDSLPPSPVPIRRSSSCSLYGADMVVEDQRQIIRSLGEHIVFSSVHTTAVMCTNLLAFLLLTKHRNKADVKQLVSDFDWLISELKGKKRDVGFSGKTIEVLHYASALLGPELVERSPKKGSADHFIPNMSLPGLFELSYYSSAVSSAFVLESVLACSVIYNCDLTLNSPDEGYSQDVCTASRDDILETATKLCQLLQYEFIFVSPCKSLEETLSDEVEQLVSMEILKLENSENNATYGTYDNRWGRQLSSTVSWVDEDDFEDTYRCENYKVNVERTDCMDKLKFLHKVLAPIMECYYVTACQINKVLKSEMPEDDFQKTIHNTAKERVANNIASYGESAALDSIKNALKAFQDLKIIDIYYAGNLRMIELHDHFEVRDRLKSYLGLLESLRD